MKARIIAVCAPLLLACPRPSDHDRTDDGAGDATSGASETTGAAPAPAQPEPQSGSTDKCAAEFKALDDAVAQVEMCVAGL